VKISVYAMAIETFAPMLRSLSEILDKGAEHARAKRLEICKRDYLSHVGSYIRQRNPS
jgi:hypothetical protein